MKFMTPEEFGRLKELNFNAYYGRWHYYERVIAYLKTVEFNTCLEIGAYLKPIVHGADVMDIKDYGIGAKYVWDASVVPWPMTERYDMLVALQVWEHLGFRQKRAFREVMLRTEQAVFSFPYKWNCPGDIHHDIDEDVIKDWTFGRKPVHDEIIGKRIIYAFDFR